MNQAARAKYEPELIEKLKLFRGTVSPYGDNKITAYDRDNRRYRDARARCAPAESASGATGA